MSHSTKKPPSVGGRALRIGLALQSQLVVDGQLITGRNSASGTLVGAATVRALREAA